jgi:DNA-binding NarL/FixJ family response regulator
VVGLTAAGGDAGLVPRKCARPAVACGSGAARSRRGCAAANTRRGWTASPPPKSCAIATARPPEVIVLTTFDADDHVLRALRAGASGFLLKDTPPADIVRAIRAVAAGEPMLSPTITRRPISHVTGSDGGERRRHAREQIDRLTEREREVAVAIGHGKSNAEISRELYMSIATVKAYVSRLLEKLEFNNRVQVALLAHDAGEA